MNQDKTFTKTKYISILFILTIFSLFLLNAETIGSTIKTSNDVYGKVMILKEYVKLLRENSNVDSDWPDVPQQYNKASRHVLQKSIEVLEKLNKLRVIKGVGRITIPPFPSRDITPNEVYDLVARLVDEAKLALKLIYGKNVTPETEKEIIRKTPNDIYRELWYISYSLDPILGVRGFNPSDVFAQTVRIISEINFLRLTQNLSLKEVKPTRTEGKHPNHALKEVYTLLEKISQSERNLLIEPVSVTKDVPRRVIAPSEVYDALQVVLAELQRIKYRLGVSRTFITPEFGLKKTPDDVILNIKRATELMPEFAMDSKLIQRDRSLLNRNLNHVFLMTTHLLNELDQYRMVRRIEEPLHESYKISGMQQRHVYQKILECIEKVNILRSQGELGPNIVPEFPLRKITPNEVYDLIVRLDSEFEIIYTEAGIEEVYEFETFLPYINIYKNRSANDVYINMLRFSRLLDTILGSKSITLEYIYAQSLRINNEIELICKYLKADISIDADETRPGHSLNDLLNKCHELLVTIYKVGHRAGMASALLPTEAVDEEITLNNVLNEIHIIRSELVALKVHLGITTQIPEFDITENKTPDHIYQLLTKAQSMLLKLLNVK